MKARPIIFSAPMVRALLDGRKTQTRRIVRHSFQYPYVRYLLQDFEGGDCPDTRSNIHWFEGGVGKEWLKSQFFVKCPFGGAGDYLWVRESFGDRAWYAEINKHKKERYYFAADGKRGEWAYKPSIHMPRCASRLTLKITDIRVERLQDISETAAQAEGAPPSDTKHENIFYHGFISLWESIHGANSWKDNPWVWVISFEVIHKNVDQILLGE